MPFLEVSRSCPELVETYMADQMPRRLVDLIQTTMANGRFPGQAPDYLALQHLRPRERSRVLRGLNLPAGQTDTLADVGHHGPNDVILSLDRGLKRGAIQQGSRVILAASGIGFTYAGALIQWGPV